MLFYDYDYDNDNDRTSANSTLLFYSIFVVAFSRLNVIYCEYFGVGLIFIFASVSNLRMQLCCVC